MKKLLLIAGLLLLNQCIRAQDEIRCITPTGPVVEGESFQVQYVINGYPQNISFKVPVFHGFRSASGPNEYSSSKNNAPVINYVYTLVPNRTGRFNIPGATAVVNGKTIRSANWVIEVISKKEAELRRADTYSG